MNSTTAASLFYLLIIFTLSLGTGHGLENGGGGGNQTVGNRLLLLRKSEKTPSEEAMQHADFCERKSSCSECVGLEQYECVWCNGEGADGRGKCTHQRVGDFWPSSDHNCEWSDKRWVVCWLDFRAMIIVVSIIGGIVLITACCCIVRLFTCVKECLHLICCCGCCKCSDWAANRKAQRSIRRLEREMERQTKRQELMMKYGIRNGGGSGAAYGTTNGDYRKFENTAA